MVIATVAPSSGVWEASSSSLQASGEDVSTWHVCTHWSLVGSGSFLQRSRLWFREIKLLAQGSTAREIILVE